MYNDLIIFYSDSTLQDNVDNTVESDDSSTDDGTHVTPSKQHKCGTFVYTLCSLYFNLTL